MKFLLWLLRGRPMVPINEDLSGFEWSGSAVGYVWVERGQVRWIRDYQSQD